MWMYIYVCRYVYWTISFLLTAGAIVEVCKKGGERGVIVKSCEDTSLCSCHFSRR